MKLLLTSSGITNKSIEKELRNLLGKPFEDSSIVFIPTAANVNEGDKSWLINDMWNFKKLGFNYFDIVDISAVQKNIWIKSMRKADILVFGGGDVYHLLSHIRKSGLEDILPELLKDKLYVGISAGSMVTAKNISLSTAGILYYEKKGRVENVKGLGFIDFELRPHLNDDFFPKVKLPFLRELSKEIPYSFYAIDDETAIKVVDEKITVISEGEWKKFN